jgi:hypothetical protein
MFSRSGKFMSDRQRKAMFSKLGLYEDDPREAMLSDKIARIIGGEESTIKYNKPEILVYTGGKAGGSYAHIFTRNVPVPVLEYTDSGMSYNIGGEHQILGRGQAGGRVKVLCGDIEDGELDEE